MESQERESSGGYKEVDLDNDLSAPSPETPNDHKLSAQVFMQISYNPLPGSSEQPFSKELMYYSCTFAVFLRQ